MAPRERATSTTAHSPLIQRAAGKWVARFPMLLVCATLLADLALLAWVGVAPLRALVFVVVLVAATGSGALLLRGRESALPDRFSVLVVSAAIGIALHVVLCFVVFHTTLDAWLGLTSRRQAALLALAILCALALAGFIGLRARVAGLPRIAHPLAASIVFLLASFVGGASHLGFGNDLTCLKQARAEVKDNTVIAEFLARTREPGWSPGAPHAPEWGGRIDSLWYVWLYPDMLDMHGLPGVFMPQTDDKPRIGKFQHLGVALQVYGLVEIAGPFSAESTADFSKLLALTWFTLFGWALFLIGRSVFAAPVGAALCAVAGGMLFAPLNLSWFLCTRTMSSNVLTYVAGPVQWNLNQLAHLAIGVSGFFLVLLDLVRPRRLYALGCLLIAVSLFCKPPFFFVAVPAIGLASLRLGRGFFRADVLLGWAAILAAGAFWFIYPRLAETPAIKAPIGIGFLSVQAEYARGFRMLPLAWIKALPNLGLKAVVLSLAYAALALPAFVLGRELFSGAERRRKVLAAATRPVVLAILLMFVWGALSGICFFEDNENRLCLNYAFGSAASYTCFLPLLTLAIARIENRPVRWCAWVVYFAHLASGLINLWIYFDVGELI